MLSMLIISAYLLSGVAAWFSIRAMYRRFGVEERIHNGIWASALSSSLLGIPLWPLTAIFAVLWCAAEVHDKRLRREDATHKVARAQSFNYQDLTLEQQIDGLEAQAKVLTALRRDAKK